MIASDLLLLLLLSLYRLQLRYVLMPGWTDGPEDVAAMLEFCRGKSSMQAIEVLPYHQLGVEVRCAVGLSAPAASSSCGTGTSCLQTHASRPCHIHSCMASTQSCGPE